MMDYKDRLYVQAETAEQDELDFLRFLAEKNQPDEKTKKELFEEELRAELQYDFIS